MYYLQCTSLSLICFPPEQQVNAFLVFVQPRAQSALLIQLLKHEFTEEYDPTIENSLLNFTSLILYAIICLYAVEVHCLYYALCMYGFLMQLLNAQYYARTSPFHVVYGIPIEIYGKSGFTPFRSIQHCIMYILGLEMAARTHSNLNHIHSSTLAEVISASICNYSM